MRSFPTMAGMPVRAEGVPARPGGAVVVLAAALLAACNTPSAGPPKPAGASKVPVPEGMSRAEARAARRAESARHAALDASVGGPLQRVELTRLRMTEDVITEGVADLASTVVACDASFGAVVGTHWYAFADDECFQGASTSALQLLHSGRDGMGCTVRWLGALRPPITAPFAGIGQDVTRAALSSFQRLRVELRGDGGTYRLQLPLHAQLEAGVQARNQSPRDAEGHIDCHDEHFDYYGEVFTCGDGTDVWTPRTFTFANLRQSGFGQAAPLDLDDVAAVQVVTVGHTPHDFQCELRIVGME